MKANIRQAMAIGLIGTHSLSALASDFILVNVNGAYPKTLAVNENIHYEPLTLGGGSMFGMMSDSSGYGFGVGIDADLFKVDIPSAAPEFDDLNGLYVDGPTSTQFLSTLSLTGVVLLRSYSMTTAIYAGQSLVFIASNLRGAGYRYGLDFLFDMGSQINVGPYIKIDSILVDRARAGNTMQSGLKIALWIQN